MSALISLDEPEALEVDRVGAKAARLAAARQRGLPVLPGLVVAAGDSRTAVSEATGVDGSRGLWRARSAILGAPLPAGLSRALRGAASLGPSLVVRSSTRLDDDGRWSGGFTSLAEIQPDELALAVGSCWSSLFSPDASARFEQAGLGPDDAGLAVLIQPQVRPELGGWARIRGDDVEVGWIEGPPAPLLMGWQSGCRSIVTSHGEIAGDEPPRRVELLPVAAMARRAFAELGTTRLEWAIADERLLLFQLGFGRAADAPTTGRRESLTGRGEVIHGIPAAGGHASGPLRAIQSPDDVSSLRDGDVLLVRAPLPVFAPLLWRVAGLVSQTGNPAAHLFEVSRGLHVPAVIAPVARSRERELIASLDGTSGDVWIETSSP